jgi:hypothetical protein
MAPAQDAHDPVRGQVAVCRPAPATSVIAPPSKRRARCPVRESARLRRALRGGEGCGFDFESDEASCIAIASYFGDTCNGLSRFSRGPDGVERPPLRVAVTLAPGERR